MINTDPKPYQTLTLNNHKAYANTPDPNPSCTALAITVCAFKQIRSTKKMRLGSAGWPITSCYICVR